MDDRLIVGEFFIEKLTDGYWIGINNDGEGMQVPKETFEKIISQFYLENF